MTNKELISDLSTSCIVELARYREKYPEVIINPQFRRFACDMIQALNLPKGVKDDNKSGYKS